MEECFFFPGEVEGSASCTQVISADGLNRLSVIHISRSSESIKSANKPGDVFIPSHSADSVAHGEDLSTWHSLTHIPRERCVHEAGWVSTLREASLLYSCQPFAQIFSSHVEECIHVYIWTVGKKRGPQREREGCV